MLRFADDLRVNLYRGAIDPRCGINTLAAVIDDSMQMDPRARAVLGYGRNCAEGAARGGHASGGRSGRPQPAIDCKRVSIYLSTHRVQQEEAPSVTLDRVRDAIVMFNDNKKAAANFLQISRQSVYRILEGSRECDN
ncbi:hypothetical protein P9281_08785 [Caballeronia sp. LP003]|uniref:hypothetical protein n=1 Tax=Caballeronia sp. LP003 TaxID=3038551 RepID=UPI00285E805F|nr:hypothetical protein [Caballeronia sp. LP003]MDR5786638.1 hypothetical protein [Caballeronia sp. LP003]